MRVCSRCEGAGGLGRGGKRRVGRGRRGNWPNGVPNMSRCASITSGMVTCRTADLGGDDGSAEDGPGPAPAPPPACAAAHSSACAQRDAATSAACRQSSSMRRASPATFPTCGGAGGWAGRKSSEPSRPGKQDEQSASTETKSTRDWSAKLSRLPSSHLDGLRVERRLSDSPEPRCGDLLQRGGHGSEGFTRVRRRSSSLILVFTHVRKSFSLPATPLVSSVALARLQLLELVRVEGHAVAEARGDPREDAFWEVDRVGDANDDLMIVAMAAKGRGQRCQG